MTVSRRRALRALGSAVALGLAGCQSADGRNEGALAISVENDDDDPHTVWVSVADDDGTTTDSLEMVTVPEGSVFQFEGHGYADDRYTVAIEADRSDRVTNEWNRGACAEFIQMVVVGGTDETVRKETDCTS